MLRVGAELARSLGLAPPSAVKARKASARRGPSRPRAPIATAPLDRAVVVTLPMRAFVKQSARRGSPHGPQRTYIPTETRRRMGWIASEAQLAMAGRLPHKGAFLLEVTAEIAPPKSWSKKRREQALSGAEPCTVKPDVDNICKMIDALKGIVFEDDCFATDAVIRKRWGAQDRLTFRVQPHKADGSGLGF